MGRIRQLAALLPFLAACGADNPPPPNVLFISLDTLRVDRLGSYGSTAGLTPELDALAAGATRWARCTATAPWTVPSHASMFTGLYPHAHGAHSFEPVSAQVDNVWVLAQEHETLAEVLAAEGYATGAVVANVAYLGPALGLDQGFDDWSLSRERAPRINKQALRWIEGVEEGRPWMLFLNYMDTHRPYNVEPQAGEQRFDSKEFSGTLLDRLYERVMVKQEPAGELGERIEQQYDRAVRNLDAALGELFAELRARGLLEHTLVVVTADHGEYFGEHGLVEHSKDVYEEALCVPLIVKSPGQTVAAVRTEPLTLAHLPRLILDELSDEISARHAAGFPLVPGEGPLVAENYYSRLRDVLDERFGERFRRVRTVLYEGEYKLIHSSDGQHELYNLVRDPGEGEDLAASEAERLERMVTQLEELLGAARFDPEQRATIDDPQHMQELRGAGYAGGTDDE